MFPYGNAASTDEDGDGVWEFDCQHGNEECRGNIWEACLIDRCVRACGFEINTLSAAVTIKMIESS